ncbi:MAG TPA: hypothetical protein VKW78_07070 [Terriglobales bacterium]|nr:hypothetical protein [Terriglobales bacterium]
MSPEAQRIEYPYTLKIETATGQSVTVPLAFLTREEIAKFLQSDFQRLAQEAGVKGTRVHVELAATADYGNVLQDVEAHLRRASLKAV